jgi:hypothetical protein
VVDRTGIGLIERLVLDTMDELGARADRPFVRSARIVDAVRSRHGVHAGYSYWVMCVEDVPSSVELGWRPWCVQAASSSC